MTHTQHLMRPIKPAYDSTKNIEYVVFELFELIPYLKDTPQIRFSLLSKKNNCSEAH